MWEYPGAVGVYSMEASRSSIISYQDTFNTFFFCAAEVAFLIGIVE